MLGLDGAVWLLRPLQYRPRRTPDPMLVVDTGLRSFGEDFPLVSARIPRADAARFERTEKASPVDHPFDARRPGLEDPAAMRILLPRRLE